MSKGIDVSEYQGKIDWTTTKQKADFAIIRASCSKHTDLRLAYNINGCIANNIPFGFYHVLYADSIEMANQEADIFLTSIKGYNPEYPIYVDTEYWSEYDKKTKELTWTNRNLSKQLWTDMIIAFCEKCKNAGYYIGIYASRNFLYDQLELERLESYDKWVADWCDKCYYTGNYGLWQYIVDKVGYAYGMQSERLDLDEGLKDYPTIIKNLGLNGWGNSQPTPVQPEPLAPTPAPQPAPVPVAKPNVIYQVFSKNGWLPEVTNYNEVNSDGYAGIYGNTISGLRVRLSNGQTVYTQSHVNGCKTNDWLGTVSKWDNTSDGYSGWKGRPTDCVGVKADGVKLKYRVHTLGGKWLDWVNTFNIANSINGIAGIYGKAIDAIQIGVE